MPNSVRPRRRRWLVGVSLVVHLAVVLGLFVAGFWKIDKLDAGKRTFQLAVALPPPAAPSGSPAAAVSEPFKPKKRVVKDTVQPTEKKTPDKTIATSDTTTVGTGTGTGPGDGPGTDPDGTGTCTDPPCGPPTATGSADVEEKIDCSEAPMVVPPSVIKGMRTSGETQIHPPDVDKTAIARSGKAKVTATVKVCVGPTGNVASLTMMKPSGFPGWDSAITSALRAWRYRPYQLTSGPAKPRHPHCPPPPTVGPRAITVCGMVTFIYGMQ